MYAMINYLVKLVFFIVEIIKVEKVEFDGLFNSVQTVQYGDAVLRPAVRSIPTHLHTISNM